LSSLQKDEDVKTIEDDKISVCSHQGQHTIAEHVRKSYSTNDLRVHDSRQSEDNPDGVPYIDDSDEEFGNY